MIPIPEKTPLYISLYHPITLERWIEFCNSNNIIPIVHPVLLKYIHAKYEVEIHLGKTDLSDTTTTIIIFIEFSKLHNIAKLVQIITSEFNGVVQPNIYLQELIHTFNQEHIGIDSSEDHYDVDSEAQTHQTAKTRADLIAYKWYQKEDGSIAEEDVRRARGLSQKIEHALKEQDKLTRYAIASELMAHCQPIEVYLSDPNQDKTGGILTNREAQNIAMNIKAV